MTTTANPAASAGLPNATPAPASEGLAAPVGTIRPRLPKWRAVEDIDGAVAECQTLARTLDAANDLLLEMNYWLPDGSRNFDLDKVSALVLVSQGLAEYLTEALVALPRPDRVGRASA